MGEKKKISRLLALMLCLVLMTNNMTAYGAELFTVSEDTAVEQNMQSDETGTEEWSDDADVEIDDSSSTGDSDFSDEMTFSDGTDSEQSDTEADDTELDVTEETSENSEAEFASEDVSDGVDSGEALFQSSDETAVFANVSASPYGKEITQDIYWKDNNVTDNRYTPEQYKTTFYNCGKVAVTYNDGEGNPVTVNVKVSDLLTDQNKMTVTDQNGTGHYIMKFEADAFPGVYTPKDSNGNPIVDSDGNPVTYNISQIKLVPPDSLVDKDIPANDKYYFQEITDANKGEHTNQDVENGWYYLKQYDFTVNLEFRYGNLNIAGMSADQKTALEAALKQAVEKEFVFSYKKKINEAYTDVSLETIRNPYGNDIVNITIDSSGNLSATLTVPKIPQYRVDGT